MRLIILLPFSIWENLVRHRLYQTFRNNTTVQCYLKCMCVISKQSQSLNRARSNKSTASDTLSITFCFLSSTWSSLSLLKGLKHFCLQRAYNHIWPTRRFISTINYMCIISSKYICMPVYKLQSSLGQRKQPLHSSRILLLKSEILY